MNELKQTPSQTVGPYFAYGLTPQQYGFHYNGIVDNNMYDEMVAGEHITITGRVFDGNGDAILDAMLELRQESPKHGFARFGTGTEKGHYFVFHTIKPSAKNNRAPFINITLMMRGLLSHVFTRIYFSDETEANAVDPILNKIPMDRKNTLIAQRREEEGKVFYDFDIYMQGEKETVFFDV